MKRLVYDVSRMCGDLLDSLKGINMSNDDVTILGLEIEDRGAYYEEVCQPQSQKDIDCIYVSLAERLCKEWDERGFANDCRLTNVLAESLVNAYKHGNREDKDKKIFIRWRWGNDLHFDVIDEGEGFDFTSLPDPTSAENLGELSGRGITMIKHSASHVAWEDSGRHLKTVFEIDRAG